ncbi:hypothetical protein [Nocardia asiatica]|uniref:hypothetical protein n=1 Tax=Nocardia asiatica TaxID=209252 RepID=UPI0024556314|nr:hypothetical protein [Nocardia asiatica]
MRRLRRSGQLAFFRDVYPWILAEITSIFCHAEISATDPVSAERFLENVADLGSARAPHEAVRALGREYGVVRELPSLQSMARPFSGRRYASGTGSSGAPRPRCRAIAALGQRQDPAPASDGRAGR